jgi:hypothetical protein
MRESAFGWAGRLRWRLRVELVRVIASLRGSRLLSNTWFGFLAVVAAWPALTLFGLLSGPEKPVDAFASAVLNTALVSVVFAVFLYFGSNRRVARRLRVTARRDPTGLLTRESAPAEVSDDPRRELYADIAEDLVDPAPVGPQLIVGEVGAGKTTALVGLARFFAERGMVPMYVSLRGQEGLDFLELAHTAFLEQADGYVAASADAERVWRWLCRSKRLVVLADDLDEAGVSGDGDGTKVHDVRRAFGTARRQGLALVVTSRPIGIPQTLALSAIRLEPISTGAALRKAIPGERRGDRERAERVRRLIDRGKLGETPFYLQIVSELERIGDLPDPAENRYVVRLQLLDAYRSALTARKLAMTAPLGADEREKTVSALAALALRELDSVETDIPVPDVIKVAQELDKAAQKIDKTAQKIDPLRLIDGAERLGLIERGRQTVRFSHEIVQSYLASTLLRSDEERLEELCDAARTPRSLNALILAAASSGDTGFAASACTHLLDYAERKQGDWGLVVVRAAADIAAISPDTSLDVEVLDAARAYAPSDERPLIGPPVAAESLTKRATVPRLAQLDSDERWHLLWDFTNDQDYAVKWSAACALRDDAAQAYAALHDRFDDYLADAHALREERSPDEVDDWEHRPVFRLKMLGWLLPSLATGVQRTGESRLAAEADRQWSELAELERAPITHQKGLEASIAQGLKVDAWALREDPDEALGMRVETARLRAFDALDCAEFWYSRIQLIHALALVEGAGSAAPRPEATRRLDEIAASDDEHPFTREAARLATRSIGTDAWRDYVWEEEGEDVAGRSALSPRAAQLVADLTLVLNLNEQGDEAQRATFGTRKDLPHCLSGSSDRGEILGVRPCSCDFGLCPYYRPERESAHRELSKAFCRQQRHIAKRLGPFGSQSINRRKLTEFWQGMEERARA